MTTRKGPVPARTGPSETAAAKLHLVQQSSRDRGHDRLLLAQVRRAVIDGAAPPAERLRAAAARAAALVAVDEVDRTGAVAVLYSAAMAAGISGAAALVEISAVFRRAGGAS